MITLTQAIEKYFRFNHELSPKTKKIYGGFLTRLVNAIGDKSLTDINHEGLTDFMIGLKAADGSDYAPGYRHMCYRSLHTFFEFCVDEEYIHKNPMKRVRPPKHDAFGVKPRLSLEQVKTLLDAAKYTDFGPRNYCLVLLMVDSGLRLSEVVGLRVKDVNLNDSSAFVSTPKTNKKRYVPISPTTIEAIKRYTRWRCPAIKSPEEALFLSRDGQPITVDVVTRLMYRLEKKVKFEVYCHLLRHTFAGLYNRKGNLKKLQKILGHADAATTARFYVDPDFDELREEYLSCSPTAQMGGAK